MGLTARERRTLDSIGDQLSGSDPKLASLLATFARLTSAETMPAREKIALRNRLSSIRRRHPRLNRACRHVAALDRRLSFKQSGLLIWLAITLGLLAIALAVSNSGNSSAACRWGTCYGQAAAYGQAATHASWKPISHPPAPVERQYLPAVPKPTSLRA